MAIRTYGDYRKCLTDLARMMENGVEVEADVEVATLIRDIAGYMARGGRITPTNRIRAFGVCK